MRRSRKKNNKINKFSETQKTKLWWIKIDFSFKYIQCEEEEKKLKNYGALAAVEFITEKTQQNTKFLFQESLTLGGARGLILLFFVSTKISQVETWECR